MIEAKGPRRQRGRARVRALAGLAVLASAGLATFAILQTCRPAGASCAVCGRDECRALAFRVEYEDGKVQETCCARCASHAVREEAGRTVARLSANDFATGRRLDARSAVYVEGSDFEHCSAPRVERGYPGCCLTREYDRCLPSLIAFGDRAAAASFMEEHGGKMKSFEDLKFGERPRPGGSR